jgi:hypothetical protein
LTALTDTAAVGHIERSDGKPGIAASQDLSERRYTKPCAQFVNGVRVGFGFVFERTCRPENCSTCGQDGNLMHNECRLFDFKSHQDVVLRSKQAIDDEMKETGAIVSGFLGYC